MSEFSWQHQAACLEEDPELFFPIGNTGPAIQQIEDAKAVCFRCPVREACLRWAVDTRQDHGVWGGMAEDERRSLKRRERRQHGGRRQGEEWRPIDRAQKAILAARTAGLSWAQIVERTGQSESKLYAIGHGYQGTLTVGSEAQILLALADLAVHA